MLQCTEGMLAARPNTSSTKHQKALTMKFVPPDTCLKDYKKRRSAFLKELIASTPNVSVRAKEFRRWIDENSPYSAPVTKPKTWVDRTSSLDADWPPASRYYYGPSRRGPRGRLGFY
jgi:hypothetical protein